MRAIGLLVIVAMLAACSRHESTKASPRPTKPEVWAAIQPLAKRYRIEPEFIYALVAAESNFDPAARNGQACGLLQIKPAAWRTVSKDPFEPTVWDWKRNLEAGVDYLAYSRAYLHRKHAFSYPLLLAAFHYGLDAVERTGFDVDDFDPPDNVIYRALWSGNLAPVPPPVAKPAA